MSEGTWEKFSQVAVKGAEHDSRERRPHPKCLEGTRVVLLNHIYGLSDTKEMNRLIWLHGTAGVGKSAVAFTVADRMRRLKMTKETKVETRLGGTFFFSRKHTKRRTTGYFFMTLAYQLAQNFPSVQTDVNRAILKDPTLLDPDKSLREQMEGLFLQPLRKLQYRLRECPPLTFVVDALDECTNESPNEYSSESRDEGESESELTELISLLAQVLRDPDLPSIHILVTSRSEAHIFEAMQNADVRPLLCEIPVKISGEGVTPIISLDGADVDEDIYRFWSIHSESCKIAIRPSRNQRRIKLRSWRSERADGTEVYELYDCILSTCADPKLAYLHLSVVAALTDPLPISQISELLGPGQGRDVEKVLVQLRSVIDVPPNRSLPVNIYHSSVRDYVYHRSNRSLYITSPHSLLAHSSLRLMVEELPGCSALLDALLALKKQSQVMEPHDPKNLIHSLSFIVQPPEPMQVLVTLLWLRGNHSSELRFWLGTQDGHAWLESLDGRAWLQTQAGKDWLQIEMAQSWLDIPYQLQTQRGQNLVSRIRTILARMPSLVLRHLPQTQDLSQTQNPLQIDYSEPGPVRDLSQTQDPLRIDYSEPGPVGDLSQTQDPSRIHHFEIRPVLDLLQMQHSEGSRSQSMSDPPQTQRKKTTRGRSSWLRSQEGKDWVQNNVGKDWVQTQWGQNWLQTQGGRHWVQTHGVPDWLQTKGGRQWLQTLGGQDWLQAFGGRNWLQSEHGQDWLQTHDGQDWLPTRGGTDWLQTRSARNWLQTPDGRDWLHTPQGTRIIPPPLHSHKAPPLPDLEIIHAMKTFSIFANKARERSQSSSDVLNYACQNWAVHTSRAPKPWDEKLAHIFKSFWDRHLLDWLERQWCVKDLQSCLTVLAEGEKFAKEHLLRIPDRLNNQSEVVGVFEGEKLVKECLLQTPGHLNDQSEVVGIMQRVVQSCITFLRMFKCQIICDKSCKATCAAEPATFFDYFVDCLYYVLILLCF
ncbi:hypothetical protein EV424DRAFT_1551697 [Suillus variegatus]|nr:hypothetical protein EV424DRAFT_1551697 [Suillus variegatus]